VADTSRSTSLIAIGSFGVKKFDTQGRPNPRPVGFPDGAAGVIGWHADRVRELVEPEVVQPMPDGELIDWQLLAQLRARHGFRRKLKRSG
jgi:hypothetical protein